MESLSSVAVQRVARAVKSDLPGEKSVECSRDGARMNLRTPGTGCKGRLRFLARRDSPYDNDESQHGRPYSTIGRCVWSLCSSTTRSCETSGGVGNMASEVRSVDEDRRADAYGVWLSTVAGSDVAAFR